MSKIWSSLGLAVLGIAILVGAAAAQATTSIPVAVDGCILQYDLDISTLPDNSIELGPLTTTTPATASDSTGYISAAVAWGLDASDTDAGTKTGHVGDMVTTGPAYLTHPLNVNTLPLSSTQEVANGDPDCEAQPLTLDYSQTRDAADTTPGDYSISVTLLLSAA